MSDLIEEIKEEVKMDQFLNFLKDYARHIVGGLLIIVISVSLYTFWQYRQNLHQIGLAQEFEHALDATQKGHHQEACDLLQKIEKGDLEGYRALASFRHASLEKMPKEEKIKIYERIMANTQIESKFRELATILWAYETIDTQDEALLQAKLQPLTTDKSPWMNSAQELYALLEIRQGNIKGALQRLQNLSINEHVVPGIRRRAFALMSQIGS